MKKFTLLGLGCLLAVCVTNASADRGEDIAKIKEFLHNDQIAQSMTKKGVEVESLLKNVESLSDAQVAVLASNTPDILQFGSGTSNVRSSSAEKISDQWLNFADKWLMIAVGFSALLLILVMI